MAKRKRKTTAKRRAYTQKKPGPGADAGGAGHPVCGAAAHRAGVRGGGLRLEECPPDPIRLFGSVGVARGRGAIWPSSTPGQASRCRCSSCCWADLCQRHGHRVFGYPRRPTVSSMIARPAPTARRLAGRRRAGHSAGRQPAPALRAACGQSGHGGAGPVCQPVYFDITPAERRQWLCNVGGGVH